MTDIYPDLENYKSETFNESFTVQELKNKLATTRLRDFENDLFYIKEKIVHYKKILKRWSRIDLGLKLSQIALGIIVGAGGVILTVPSFGLSLGVIGIPLATGVITVIPIVGTLNSSWVKSRKRRYEKLINGLEATKNKLFLFHQKALNDEILTDEEIETSKRIVNEAHELISKTKTVNRNDDVKQGTDMMTLLENQNKVINEMMSRLR